MKKKKIKVNLMKGDAVAAQLTIPVNEDPAGEWPKAVENAIDQSGIRNIIDFVTREPESAADQPRVKDTEAPPHKTQIHLSVDEVRKINDLVDEIKGLLEELKKAAHIQIVEADELPF